MGTRQNVCMSPAGIRTGCDSSLTNGCSMLPRHYGRHRNKALCRHTLAMQWSLNGRKRCTQLQWPCILKPSASFFHNFNTWLHSGDRSLCSAWNQASPVIVIFVGNHNETSVMFFLNVTTLFVCRSLTKQLLNISKPSDYTFVTKFIKTPPMVWGYS